MTAVAIGTSIWLPAILFGHGLLHGALGACDCATQWLHGRRRRLVSRIRFDKRVLWLAGFVSVLVMIVCGMPDTLSALCIILIRRWPIKPWVIFACCVVGRARYLFFQVARNQCEDSLAKTKPGMVMGILGLLVNIPVNYIFIYGSFWYAGTRRYRLRRCDCAVYCDAYRHASYIKHARSMRDIRNEKAFWQT